MSKYTSIVHDILFREIKINTDAGRVMRPLFVVERIPSENGIPKNQVAIKQEHIKRLSLPDDDPNQLTFSGLVKEGLIDFLDVEQEETAMIAMFL